MTVVTDLAITGRAAQFGRGVMADVSTKLLGQFVSCLEKNVLGAGAAAPAASAAPAAEEAPAEVGASKATASGGGSAQSAPVTREPGGASDAALAGGTSGTNGAKSADAGATVPSGPRQVVSRPADPVDLLGTAGSPVIKRLVPAVIGALVAFLIGRKLRRRRSA